MAQIGHSIPYFFTSIVSLLFGVIILFRNPRDRINLYWGILGITVSIWSLCFGITISSRTLSQAVFWGRLSHFAASFIPFFYLYFVYALLRKKIGHEQYIAGFCAVFFAIFSLTPSLIRTFSPKMHFTYYFEPGILYFWFILAFLGVIGIGLYRLLVAARTAGGHLQNQLKYVILASCFGFGAGASTFPLVFDIPIYSFGGLVFVYNIIITYAIIRYRLMDIKLIITRTGIFVIVYALVLGVPFAFAIWSKRILINTFAAHWWVVPLTFMAVLATAGPFVYSYIEHKAENTLLKEQKRYQRTLKQASVGMTRIRNLRRLLDLIAHIVTKTVRISYAAIYLYNPEANQYELQVHRGQLRSFIPRIAAYSPIITSFRGTYEALVYDEVKRKAQESQSPQMISLEQSMHAIPSAVIIPSFLEARLMGFIVLGEKVSGHIYTPEDLNVFQVLASQAALAIENAQFYEEAKTMQEQIAQAEKMATIGTMADGLSHQINNRFYALSLIASDSIDTIKMTDTANCSPEIKEMLSAVSKALERIQVNVMQGGEVVKGILKYTRKGDEGFEALSLDRVLDGTIDMIKYKIKISRIDIVRDIPDDAPKIKGNQVQLQEAFFNLLDNAYDATGERESTLEEKDYRGKIVISLKALSHSRVQITIKDNGMGVKDQNAKKLFTPFFTTKTSSRKGTGLGLYVIKRIISEIHGGSISVESVYKQGTTFTLELPVAR